MINSIPVFKLSSADYYTSDAGEVDIYSALYFNHWYLFVSDNERAELNFGPNGKFELHYGNDTCHGAWKIANNKQLIISYDITIYLAHLCYFDKKLLLFQLEGTEDFIILLEYSMIHSIAIRSLEDVNYYLEHQSVVPRHSLKVVRRAQSQGKRTSDVRKQQEHKVAHHKTIEELEEEKHAKELNAALSSSSYSCTHDTVETWTSADAIKQTCEDGGSMRSSNLFLKVVGILLLVFVLLVMIVAAFKVGWGRTGMFLILFLFGLFLIALITEEDHSGCFTSILTIAYLIYIFYCIFSVALG